MENALSRVRVRKEKEGEGKGRETGRGEINS